MITVKHKEGNLTWYKSQQVLTKNYSDISYVSDVMSSYIKITQAEEELVMQYLVKSKTYLEGINYTSKELTTHQNYPICMVEVLITCHWYQE